jgi:hypothetical protein
MTARNVSVHAYRRYSSAHAMYETWRHFPTVRMQRVTLGLATRAQLPHRRELELPWQFQRKAVYSTIRVLDVKVQRPAFAFAEEAALPGAGRCRYVATACEALHKLVQLCRLICHLHQHGTTQGNIIQLQSRRTALPLTMTLCRNRLMSINPSVL